jgi:hypothetical protein
LRNAYEADKIILTLGSLHEHFYPTPSKFTRASQGYEVTPNKPEDGLSQDELTKLWRLCGSKLHRGKLKKLDTRQSLKKVRAKEIAVWQRRIFHLLDVHLITCLSTKGALYLVRLGGTNQAPQAAFLKSVDLQDDDSE